MSDKYTEENKLRKELDNFYYQKIRTIIENIKSLAFDKGVYKEQHKDQHLTEEEGICDCQVYADYEGMVEEIETDNMIEELSHYIIAKDKL